MRALVAIVALAACGKDAPPKLDDLGEVPVFALRDHTDAELTEAWLRDHVTIVDFVFTRCDTICPVMSLKMARLAKQTEDLPAVRLLSFSVDPAYDQPAVLATYAAQYDADPARWRFVTGDYDAVRTIAEGALMTAMEPQAGTTPSGAPDIRHGGHFLLVDQDLHIRGVYDSAVNARMELLARDARSLARPP